MRDWSLAVRGQDSPWMAKTWPRLHQNKACGFALLWCLLCFQEEWGTMQDSQAPHGFWCPGAPKSAQEHPGVPRSASRSTKTPNRGWKPLLALRTSSHSASERWACTIFRAESSTSALTDRTEYGIQVGRNWQRSCKFIMHAVLKKKGSLGSGVGVAGTAICRHTR